MRVHIIIVLVSTLHFLQAMALYLDPSAMGVTSIYTMGRTLGIPLSILTFVAVSCLALWSQFLSVGRAKWLLLWPQQAVLFVSGGAAIGYIALAHFADGVPRSHAFIAADQSVTVLLALGHFWALIETMRGSGNGPRPR